MIILSLRFFIWHYFVIAKNHDNSDENIDYYYLRYEKTYCYFELIIMYI